MSQQINLFNPIFLRQEKHFSALAMVQLLGIIAVALVGLGGYSQYRLSGLRVDATRASSQLAKAQAQLQQLVEQGKPKDRDPAAEAEIQALEARLQEQRKVLDFVQHSAASARGYSEYFRAFARQRVEGLWLTGFTIAGDEMQIDGRAFRASQVPTYLMGIRKEALFQGRSFANLQIQGAEAANRNESKARNEEGAATGPAFVEFSLRTSPDAIATTPGVTK